MKRTDNENGSYILTAEAGRDLAVKDESGNVIARTKEVLIPAAGTLNTWVEVPEEMPKPVDRDAEKAARIAALEAELAALKNTLTTGGQTN